MLHGDAFSGIWSVNHDLPTDTTNTDWFAAALIGAEIIRWLPLLAANDFLAHDGDVPPLA